MTIRIDGTNTAANPGITGTDTDTGLQFGTDEIQLVTGGTNRATVESNGNFTIEDGNLVVAAGHGIDFSDTADSSGTMASELLDDYEEGSWSPVGNIDLAGAVSSRYIKIGRFVTVTSRITFPSSSSGTAVNISGLPFGVDDDLSNSAMANAVGETSYTATDRPVACVENSDVIRFRIAGSTSMTYSNLSGHNIRFSVSYFSST